MQIIRVVCNILDNIICILKGVYINRLPNENHLNQIAVCNNNSNEFTAIHTYGSKNSVNNRLLNYLYKQFTLGFYNGL